MKNSATFSCDFYSNNIPSTLKATAHIENLGQGPYFAITAELFENGRLVACGCLHDMIEQYLPEAKPLIKWHLVSFTDGPMHYIENSLFWWKRSLLEEMTPLYKGDTCAIGEKALEHFKRAIVFGVLPFDKKYIEKFSTLKSRKAISLEDLNKFLKNRKPALMTAFRKELKSFGLGVEK